MSKLLINENPIMIIPSLALKMGLNEAVVLQQIHYWLVKSSHVMEGRKWIYNTYKEWHVQLPFWSESTIKRTIKSLENQGYLIAANFNRSKMDQTKWYSIDYEKLSELDGHNEQPSDQNELNSSSDCTEQEGRMTQAIPEIPTETTTEINNIPFSEVIQYLNDKTNATYRAGTRKSMELIRARWKEGFRLDDFKKVIDLKAAEWLNDPNWNKYLRPETLFGTKFESYLNQKSPKKQWREEDFDLDD
ncbi:conserved phage C-terminal domain-containing protein [Bacillus sp. JJ1503]|uniref:conserved phage C-terminal domain-containing protein n=1 Tax=Bacillus sp. JJ1503 TaxID=3122956 RepID=UPI002FFFC352